MNKKNSLSLLFCWLAIGLITAANQIGVSSPAYCSYIQGTTEINIVAPSFKKVNVFCWKQGEGFGSEATVGSIDLDEEGKGSIQFPADEYPHGPITVRITGMDGTGTSDNCFLQLYNLGGVSWNEGIPDTDPVHAEGMELVFSDDFNSKLSIGNNSATYRYYDHKTGGGDFSSIPFTSHSNPLNTPFSQKDTYLRIRADKNKNSTGIISSVFHDRKGVMATAPCYFECRFVGPFTQGSWPAFWLLSVKENFSENNEPNDELDIIEAYGSNNPNDRKEYKIADHAWVQTGEALVIDNEFRQTTVSMPAQGITSGWNEAFHVYACKIREDSTFYYCDDKVMAKTRTLPLSRTKPLFFLVNLAATVEGTTRYGGMIDMYVDYVRVYQGKPTGILSPEVQDLNVSITPNPTGEKIMLSLYLPETENVSLTLHNTLGQQISSHRTQQQGNVKLPIDMSNLNSGVYFAKITVGNQQTSKTIIKI